VQQAPQTRPFDIVVALRLLQPSATLAVLAQEVAASPSQVHAALRRLEYAGLLKPESRATNPRALLDFLIGGVRYAFPAQRGPLRDGVPTAYSADPLNVTVDAVDALVWPAPGHPRAVRGFSIIPLFRRAPLLVERSPETYRLLTIVDALRLGDPRLRPHARAALELAFKLEAPRN
jgi:hypothetical protein